MVTTSLLKVIILAKIALACKINKVLCVGAVSYGLTTQIHSRISL